MEKQTIIDKVLRRIDEMMPELTDGTIAGYNISDFIDEAVLDLLSNAPAYLLTHTDFKSTPTVKNEDGSGSILLPDGFVKLVEFQMQGWERPVMSAITTSHPLYIRQFNPILRGGIAKPIVAINGKLLEYFSLPKEAEHEVRSAKCIVMHNCEQIVDTLIEPLCWQVASLVLDVKNEPTAAASAKARYVEIIKTLHENNNSII